MGIDQGKEKLLEYSSLDAWWQTVMVLHISVSYTHLRAHETSGKQLWSYISKFDPHILSAYVEESFDPNCIPGKTEWLRRNAGMSNRSKINLVRRKEKKLFAKKGSPSILIDDYEKNVREFINAGGKAIHHTNTSKTISELKKLGF